MRANRPLNLKRIIIRPYVLETLVFVVRVMQFSHNSKFMLCFFLIICTTCRHFERHIRVRTFSRPAITISSPKA